MNKPVSAGYWIGGANSLLEPNALRENEYQWGNNVSNRGGAISTRQGFTEDGFHKQTYSTGGSANLTVANQAGIVTVFTYTGKVGNFEVGQMATVVVPYGGYNDGIFRVVGFPQAGQIAVENPTGHTNPNQRGTITTPPFEGAPQGMTLFQPKGKKMHKVVAKGGEIWASEYPFVRYSKLYAYTDHPILKAVASGNQSTFTLDAPASVLSSIGHSGTVRILGTKNGTNDGEYPIVTGRYEKDVSFYQAIAGGVSQDPETGIMRVPHKLDFSDLDNPTVFFEIGIKNVDEDSEGRLTVIDPYPVLIIQTGRHRAAMWDGTTARLLSPKEAHIGKMMKWIGGRLWVADGNRLHAGNLLDPLSATEEDLIADGGFFSFPSDITGLGATPNQRELLVFTEYITYAIQAGITDRTQWRTTADFQRVLLPGIGCAAPKSIVNQFGMTWWYSHGGLIGIDNALQTYHTSKIHYKDEQMMRSKSNLSGDISGICCAPFENQLLVSVPSGDRHNAHTWVLDQSVIQTNESISPSSWAGIYTGIRPVEWATGIVGGVSRIYCLSRDYASATYDDYISRPWDFAVRVWEPFHADRMDVMKSGEAKRVQCSFETKMLGMGEAALTEFQFAELDISEIDGIVDLEVFYAGSRGGYTKIMGKTLTAAAGSIGWPYRLVGGIVEPTITPNSIIQFFRPQRRMVRTEHVAGGRGEANDSGSAESIYNQNVDRSFSILVKWTGKMTILGLRIFTKNYTEPDRGKCELDETDNTAVTATGGKLTSLYTPVQGSTNNRLLKSKFRMTFSPRYVDGFYNSSSLS